MAWAQIPHIGHIDFYGLRKVSEQRIRNILSVRTGDPLPPSKSELEERLEQIPGIVVARLEAVCCESGQATLFVGVEEKSAPHFAFRSPPAGEALLPDETVQRYQKFLGALEEAARNGNTNEDLTRGHPLSADPAVRDLQEQFVEFTKDHLKELREVLRNSSDGEHRVMAATLIGYAPRKSDVVDDLQYAMQDPDEAVRANAMRALGAIAVLASKPPDLEIKIAPTWFIEMLNSIILSDRYRAAMTLVNLTEKNAPDVLAQIRERALRALVEMAQWETLRYALPAYILLGRIGGLTEDQIHESWTKGERAGVVAQVVGPGKKKR